MPLNPNFSATESLADPNEITLTDTSTGSDGTITTRRVYIQLANGNWLTEAGESTTVAYESWAYADTSIVLDVLTKSTACTITVEWYAGAVLTYSVTEEFVFNIYDYLFALETLQGVTSEPDLIQDTGFYSNFIKLIVDIFNSENAITYGGDIYSSQEALNRNNLMIENEAYYF
jgi:hypothetical protein